MKVLERDQFADFLKPRQRDAHKGHFGHVLIVGGDYGYRGAVRLAASAALRVGAGLVSVATRLRYADLVNAEMPEMMTHAVETPTELNALLASATVLVLGPGLGQSAWGVAMQEAALSHDLPLVVDADGLNQLANFPRYRTHWILTPHPAEAARLLKKTTAAVQEDREAAVQSLVQTFGGVAVLKGMGTCVASQDAPPAICKAGNPGMATAGMGDVLSGVIGGLLAQGLPLRTAAELGVLVHAMAGDLAAVDGERGMLATDLVQRLRQVVNLK